ncbi:MAG TPA: DUF4440 domain-containing protein, partial [Nitrosospira sp.]|nr:DUF4440 domain-containing protein [Nitrosospira sp.]
NAEAQTKLAMIKDLFAKRSRVAAVSPPATPVPVPGSSVAIEEKPSSKPDHKSAAKTEKPAEKIASVEKLESAKPDVQGESGEILDTITAWAKAWSDKDVPTYLGFYSSEFRAPGSASRNAWEKTRRDRIIKPKSIEVSIANPKVSFTDATHAKVSFRQSYHSDAIKSNTTKTLEMVKNGQKWQILHEQVGR